MTTPDSPPNREIVIVRLFEAPRELVFRNWIDPEHVQEWFAPDGYTTTHCRIDARPGGAWRVEYRSSRGEPYIEHGRFLEVSAPERLVFSLTQEHAGGRGRETVVTVSFAQFGALTEMHFRQTGFDSAEWRGGNAEGWMECFRKLATHFAAQHSTPASTAERELRALFSAWSQASVERDLDASMAPIADHVVSYEHDAPLQYVGAATVREVCRRGLDAAHGDFRWDVPDLQIVVRGDIAVTWGLNRMRGHAPGQPEVTSWSRGTRVFQKIDGAWKLIHQHVSFPCDPETMTALPDLRP